MQTFTNGQTGESVEVIIEPIIAHDDKKYKYKEDGWVIIYPEKYDEVMAELNGKVKIKIFAFLKSLARYDFETKMFGFEMPSQTVVAADTEASQPQVSSTIKILKETEFIVVVGKRAYVNPFIYMSGIKNSEQLPCQEAWKKKFIQGE